MSLWPVRSFLFSMRLYVSNFIVLYQHFYLKYIGRVDNIWWVAGTTEWNAKKTLHLLNSEAILHLVTCDSSFQNECFSPTV